MWGVLCQSVLQAQASGCAHTMPQVSFFSNPSNVAIWFTGLLLFPGRVKCNSFSYALLFFVHAQNRCNRIPHRYMPSCSPAWQNLQCWTMLQLQRIACNRTSQRAVVGQEGDAHSTIRVWLACWHPYKAWAGKIKGCSVRHLQSTCMCILAEHMHVYISWNHSPSIYVWSNLVADANLRIKGYSVMYSDKNAMSIYVRNSGVICVLLHYPRYNVWSNVTKGRMIHKLITFGSGVDAILK